MFLPFWHNERNLRIQPKRSLLRAGQFFISARETVWNSEIASEACIIHGKAIFLVRPQSFRTRDAKTVSASVTHRAVSIWGVCEKVGHTKDAKFGIFPEQVLFQETDSLVVLFDDVDELRSRNRERLADFGHFIFGQKNHEIGFFSVSIRKIFPSKCDCFPSKDFF
ncbi:hypothetical protein MarSH_350 [Marseillevirus Shanghai 1]|nr:hypothetical protein MarSH_350 [Marseillevirus Shanghai 1]